MVRGSHLFRDPSGLRAGADPERGMSADDVLRDGWLRGRRHPITGEPMDLGEHTVACSRLCLLSFSMDAVWLFLLGFVFS